MVTYRNRFSSFVRVCLALAAVWMLMGIVTVGAQPANLLTNPGFETFETVPGETDRVVAAGWLPWNVARADGMSTSELAEPEYYPASDVDMGLGVPRILSGSDAQQYFTFFATHAGGVYQVVNGVTAGDTLTFTVNAWLWSSSFDDADVSDQDGGLYLQVGVDPSGASDAPGANTVWSEPQQTYDAYDVYTVSAAATGTSVSVWVRSVVTFPVKNNVIYLDDASLTGGDGAAITPDVTVETTVEAATDTPTTEATATETATLEATVEAPTLVPTEFATAEETAVVEPATDTPTTVPTVEAPTLVIVTEEATATPTDTATTVPTVVPPTSVPPTEQAIASLVPTSTPFEPTVPPLPSATEFVPSQVPTQTFTASITNTPRPRPTLDTVLYPYVVQYTTANGDSVSRIAQRYGSSIDAIIVANNLGDDALIFVGQLLQVPVQALPTATSALPPTTVPTIVILPTNTPTVFVPTQVPAVGSTAISPTLSPNLQLYTVLPGDSLSSIASRFGVRTRDIARLNNIVNPDLIYFGQRLVIPTPGGTPIPPPATPTATPEVAQRYVVRYGDNLYTLSIRYGVPVSVLVQANNIANPNRIYSGQVLTIPVYP